VPPVHLHRKALPKLLQSFEFASWFAIFTARHACKLGLEGIVSKRLNLHRLTSRCARGEGRRKTRRKNP
jgi:hypothetical protein